MAVVVISGEVGCSEEQIAALAAQSLGYQVVNRQQVHKLAQACDTEFEKACSFYEEAYGEKERFGFFDRLIYSNPSYVSLFESLHLELAGRDNVVILGRGPQIVLRDIPGILKVRIVAPTLWRAQRVAGEKNISLDEATAYVNKFDRSRRALMESIYGVDLFIWLYDMSLNRQCFSPDALAELICRAVEKTENPLTGNALRDRLKGMEVAKRVESKILKKVVLSTVGHLQITATADGVVTLSGYVQDRYSSDQAEEIALAAPGVSRIVNQLKTTDLSFPA